MLFFLGLEVACELWAVAAFVPHHEAVVALSHRAGHLRVAPLLADVAVSRGVVLEAEVDDVLVDVDGLTGHLGHAQRFLALGLLEIPRRRELHLKRAHACEHRAHTQSLKEESTAAVIIVKSSLILLNITVAVGCQRLQGTEEESKPTASMTA